MKFFYDNDADLKLIQDKIIGIIGYGNQGRAHALNLMDSGLNVIVGLRERSTNIQRAISHGLNVKTIEETSELADYLVLLIPDESHSDVFRKSVLPYLSEGKILSFAHGFSLLFKEIVPPENIDVVINSPKCIGYLVRENFKKNYGFPNLIAVHQNFSGRAKDYALAYARGIGGTRAGVMDSNVEEEAVTNLFGEQSVLCGGIVELIKAAFDTLVEAGYNPEVAFFECMHEIKPIIDLFYKEGLNEMNRRISNTAEYGEYCSGPRIIDRHVRENMKKVLLDIKKGKFAEKWIEEYRSGFKNFNNMRKRSETHPIDKVGVRMRKMMPWLKNRS
ncbi:ketol-acid reductoisomerase [candidate division KSB1 bacterium]